MILDLVSRITEEKLLERIPPEELLFEITDYEVHVNLRKALYLESIFIPEVSHITVASMLIDMGVLKRKN